MTLSNCHTCQKATEHGCLPHPSYRLVFDILTQNLAETDWEIVRTWLQDCPSWELSLDLQPITAEIALTVADWHQLSSLEPPYPRALSGIVRVAKTVTQSLDLSTIEAAYILQHEPSGHRINHQFNCDRATSSTALMLSDRVLNAVANPQSDPPHHSAPEQSKPDGIEPSHAAAKMTEIEWLEPLDSDELEVSTASKILDQFDADAIDIECLDSECIEFERASWRVGTVVAAPERPDLEPADISQAPVVPPESYEQEPSQSECDDAPEPDLDVCAPLTADDGAQDAGDLATQERRNPLNGVALTQAVKADRVEAVPNEAANAWGELEAVPEFETVEKFADAPDVVNADHNVPSGEVSDATADATVNAATELETAIAVSPATLPSAPASQPNHPAIVAPPPNPAALHPTREDQETAMPAPTSEAPSSTAHTTSAIASAATQHDLPPVPPAAAHFYTAADIIPETKTPVIPFPGTPRSLPVENVIAHARQLIDKVTMFERQTQIELAGSDTWPEDIQQASLPNGLIPDIVQTRQAEAQDQSQ